MQIKRSPKQFLILGQMHKFFAILFFILFPFVVLGQSNTGSIEGKVFDTDSQVVSFASISVWQNNMLSRQSKSNWEGNFKIKPLDEGQYTITVNSLMSGKDTLKDIVVLSNSVTSLDLILKRTRSRRLSLYRPCPYCGETYRFSRVLEKPNGAKTTMWLRKHCNKETCWQKEANKTIEFDSTTTSNCKMPTSHFNLEEKPNQRILYGEQLKTVPDIDILRIIKNAPNLR